MPPHYEILLRSSGPDDSDTIISLKHDKIFTEKEFSDLILEAKINILTKGLEDKDEYLFSRCLFFGYFTRNYLLPELEKMGFRQISPYDATYVKKDEETVLTDLPPELKEEAIKYSKNLIDKIEEQWKKEGMPKSVKLPKPY